MSTVPVNPQANRKPGSPSGNKPAQPRYGRMDLAIEHVNSGINRAKDWFLGQQHADGYWCGELEADVMLEADYIFMHFLLGTGDPGKMQARPERDSPSSE